MDVSVELQAFGPVIRERPEAQLLNQEPDQPELDSEQLVGKPSGLPDADYRRISDNRTPRHEVNGRGVGLQRDRVRVSRTQRATAARSKDTAYSMPAIT